MNEFVLQLSNQLVIDVKALVPTGVKNGWREITFAASFDVVSTEEMKELTVDDVLTTKLVGVDFGTLKVNTKDAQGNDLTPRDFALAYTYTRNALIATVREELLVKNVDGKNSKTSRGR